jgi:16S rRNA (guanine1207-N2)-methyltransferase
MTDTGVPGRELFDAVIRRHTLTYGFESHGVTLQVRSLPGVFSHGHADEGTQKLLETLDEPPASPVLDLGCGCGLIGTWVARRWPALTVDMVDASAVALASARLTASANGPSDADVWASDVFSDVAGVYGTILSNPPFHEGVLTQYRTVEQMLRGAVDHLRPGGRLRLVANRSLPYPSMLEESFGAYRVVSEDRRYRVFEAAVGGSG